MNDPIWGTHTALVLGFSTPDPIDESTNLLELGFSSFTAMELCNSLQLHAGLTMDPTAIFDHPTPLALAQHLRNALPASEESASS